MAMDYEFRILAAEKELAHLRDMQKLNATRLDVGDERFDAIESVLARTVATNQRTANNLELLGVKVGLLGAKVDLLAEKIDKLVDGLFKPAQNGGTH